MQTDEIGRKRNSRGGRHGLGPLAAALVVFALPASAPALDVTGTVSFEGSVEFASPIAGIALRRCRDRTRDRDRSDRKRQQVQRYGGDIVHGRFPR